MTRKLIAVFDRLPANQQDVLWLAYEDVWVDANNVAAMFAHPNEMTRADAFRARAAIHKLAAIGAVRRAVARTSRAPFVLDKEWTEALRSRRKSLPDCKR